MWDAELGLGDDVVDFTEGIHLDVEHISDALRLTRLIMLFVNLGVLGCELHVLFLDYHRLLFMELRELSLIVEADLLIVLYVEVRTILHQC